MRTKDSGTLGRMTRFAIHAETLKLVELLLLTILDQRDLGEEAHFRPLPWLAMRAQWDLQTPTDTAAPRQPTMSSASMPVSPQIHHRSPPLMLATDHNILAAPIPITISKTQLASNYEPSAPVSL